MRYKVIPFEQPAGNFLLTSMPATELIRIARADPRKFDENKIDTVGGIQRAPSSQRIREIAYYATTVDATFPTVFLLSINSSNYNLLDGELEIRDEKVADIVDGQHRILGLIESGRASDFEIPVVFMLDATEEQKALIFATINGKQTKVPASLIYDLFGVTKTRSPQKTAHEIARAMNRTSNSPWFRRLKMLGRKTPGSLESLSQGTFVKFLLPHISSDPVVDMNYEKEGKELPSREECVFNEYYRSNQDSVILKILLNLFKAVKDCWPSEWNNPLQYILTKTLGYTGIMKALPELVRKGRAKKDLTDTFFLGVFDRVKERMATEEMEITSDYFSSSALGEDEFRDIILNIVREI